MADGALWRQAMQAKGLRYALDADVRGVINTPEHDADLTLVDVAHWGTVAFQGSDASEFLQGYLTVDTTSLDGRAAHGALCTLQGRMVATMLITGHADDVRLTMHRSTIPLVVDTLAKYLPFSRSKVEVLDDQHVVAALSEGTSDALAHIVGVNDCSAGYATNIGSVTAVRWPDLDAIRPWLFLASGRDMLTLVEDLERFDSGWSETSSWDDALVRGGWLELEAVASGRYLPQMAELGHFGRIDFGKGCYLGQEVVARAEYRGQVKRGLGLYLCEGQPPPVGTALFPEDNAQERQKSVADVVAVGRGAVLTIGQRDLSELFPAHAASLRLQQHALPYAIPQEGKTP